jgi:hypothetical protein
MQSNGHRSSTALATIALVGIVILAGLILFSRFAVGAEIFQCISGASHEARVACFQRVVVERLNRRF